MFYNNSERREEETQQIEMDKHSGQMEESTGLGAFRGHFGGISVALNTK